MNRILLFASMMILFSSCGNEKSSVTLDYQNQQLGLTSIHNARQLGGYVIGNKQIKQNLLLRTASLATLSGEDSVVLADKYNVQRIYDFRGQKEAMSAPDVIPGDASHLSLAISFAGTENASSAKSEGKDMLMMLVENADNPAIQDMCENMYDQIFFDEVSNDAYRRLFADLVTLDPENGAVIWHCTQGKDRAGSASAMILAALGADRELIMEDYKLSKVYFDPFIQHIPVQNETQRNVLSTLISANPVLFEKTLDKVDATYGSFRNYLTERLGVTPEMMETLREKYLEERASK